MSIPEFLSGFGAEAQRAEAVQQARWPAGSQCPRCSAGGHYVVGHGARSLFQSRQCRHQVSLTVGSLMEHTKLPLTTWHATHCLSGNVQMDDAYLGGERVGGKTGRGSEDKVPFVAVGSTNAKVHPMYLKLHLLSGFTSEAIGKWAKANLTHGTKIISDGLTCFAAVVDAGCMHEPRVVGGLQLCNLPELKGVNTVLCNIKTTLAEVFCELKYGKYSQRYLAAFAYRFNRRFDLRALVARLIVDLVRTTPFNEMVVRAQTKTAF